MGPVMGRDKLMAATIEQWITRINRFGDRTDLNDGTVRHCLHRDAERYAIDFAEDFKAGGWKQFDTSQDAWYFGVWVNPSRLGVLTYCEGDWSFEVCPGKDQYNALIRSMCECYDDGYVAKSIDVESGITTTLVQDRAEFFI